MKVCYSIKERSATLPKYMTGGAAGMDIFSSSTVTIQPGQAAYVPTGIAFELPRGTYMKICGRSSLALKHTIFCHDGIIDEDYRGEVGVVLCNLGKALFTVKKGDRVAQCILHKYEKMEMRRVSVRSMSRTERGEGGFGSTGSN